MLSIVNANYNDEYKILLEFSDHKKGEVDLAPEYLCFKTFENDSTLQEKFHEWGYV